ncbi:MAG: hypothetical protein AAGF94_09135 [Pseudomonadota bacterium]
MLEARLWCAGFLDTPRDRGALELHFLHAGLVGLDQRRAVSVHEAVEDLGDLALQRGGISPQGSGGLLHIRQALIPKVSQHLEGQGEELG